MVAFRGAGVRCPVCKSYVAVSHTLSSGITSGLAAFMFIPFLALLFIIGSGWWVAVASVIALLAALYTYEALSGEIRQYNHASVAGQANKNLLALATILLLGVIASAVT